MEDIQKRFWRKVNQRGPSDCWEWKGGKGHNGYGMFWLNHLNQNGRAHRIAYFLTYGEIPLYNEKGEELIVCHHCDNTSCCNPNHLFLGTHQDNITDMMSKERSRLYTGTKLHAGEIWLIRKLWDSHKFTSRYIAKMFKICHQTVLRVKNRKRFCKEGYFI